MKYLPRQFFKTHMIIISRIMALVLSLI